MDSPQSVVSPFKIGESENENSTSVQSSVNRSNGVGSNGQDSGGCGRRDLVGTLEVYVHQARDIQNICIYHKQDVYAKLCLTSDPEKSVSTKIINGGGRNPVFDDVIKLDVRVVDASLKCEIYMMSRVKNYLEDQLLGFTLVPMSELLLKNGKFEKEFSLSSTDLYHSPAGFVQLSLSYNGSYPEVMAIPSMPSSITVDETSKRSESVPGELDRIEFPDPNVANENEKMVSEYFRISCSTIDSEASDSLVTSDAENHVTNSVTSVLNQDSPESSNATNGAASPHASAHSATEETQSREHISLLDSKANSQESGTEASGETSEEKVVKPVLTVKVEPESKVVQQDIVDMYMKSMQQFTDSLAKMKLPLDIDSPTKSENSSADSQKLPTPTKSNNNGSRVFYGSRPFF